MGRPKLTDEQRWIRFWNKVDKNGPNGCWEWTGAKIPQGYGAYPIDRRQTGAHRLSYEMAYGPVPEGHLVHHKCENKGCVNPGHLEALTERQHGRHQPLATATHCKRGHPFDEYNTGWQGPQKQWRICKTCWRARTREAEERRKQRRRKS